MSDPPLGFAPGIGGAVELDPSAVGPTLILVGVLLAFSALFSGSETAISALQPMDREKLRAEGRRGERVAALEADIRPTLAAVLMGNELVNISLSSVCAGLILTLAPGRPWLNLLVATPLLILLGEVTPKSIALAAPRRWALAVAAPLSAWKWLISPFRKTLTWLVDLILHALGADAHSPNRVLQEDQVRKLIQEGREAGSINVLEHELIDRLFNFSDTRVSRLMTPRPDVISFPLSTPYDQLVEQLRTHQVSRVPIYQGRMDNVVGVLLTKDLLRFKGRAPPTPRELAGLLQDPYYVPSSKRADDLLREFQRRRTHMALVVDEHGGLVGLCTLDDLLGELVGEMLDEHDEASDEISRVGPNAWTVAGSTDVEDFETETGVELPEGDYHTVGGFMFAELGHIPEPGEAVVVGDLRLTVAGVEERRITEVTLELIDGGPNQEAS
ncbi:MAG: HlyC/CorC family transporter [Alphaproteobacteria bacterium]|nr:HlyC/CorC family transporter [Alphaproteobacteria bacterium]